MKSHQTHVAWEKPANITDLSLAPIGDRNLDVTLGTRDPRPFGSANNVRDRPESDPALLGHPRSEFTFSTFYEEAIFRQDGRERRVRRLERRTQYLDLLQDMDGLRLRLGRLSVLDKDRADDNVLGSLCWSVAQKPRETYAART